MRTRPRFMLVAFLGALLIAQGCSSSARKSDKANGKKGGTTDGSAAAGLPGPAEVTEASLRGKTFQLVHTLATVRFEYDSDTLGEEARAALKANAAWLKSNGKVEIQIQGHCDERGTVAYNLALGQKRAHAVRDYYRALGVSMRRMSTISYGKERPDCPESADECWRTNRRAESRARVAK